MNLGFRWDFNGAVTEADNKLNYAFDPTIVNPVSARVGQQVMGGHQVRRRRRRAEPPWKYDKNNYQFRAGMAYQLNEQDRVPRRLGQVLPQPDRPVVQHRVQRSRHRSIASNDGSRTPTYALANPCPNGIQDPPGQLARAR